MNREPTKRMTTWHRIVTTLTGLLTTAHGEARLRTAAVRKVGP